MGFFDNFGKGVSDFGQAALQKGKGIANTAKYNRLISEEEKNKSKIYEAIGRLYLELHPEDYEEAFSEMVQGISQADDKISDYKTVINELQGIIKCPECGTDIANDAEFCPECGVKLGKKDGSLQNEKTIETKVFCTNCGMLIDPRFKFCSSCGTKVEMDSDSQE